MSSNANGSAVLLNGHVKVARCQPGVPGHDGLIRLSFVDRETGSCGKAFRQELGENRWHVLHDKNRNREIARETGQ
jgi:hypothetical protein